MLADSESLVRLVSIYSGVFGPLHSMTVDS